MSVYMCEFFYYLVRRFFSVVLIIFLFVSIIFIFIIFFFIVSYFIVLVFEVLVEYILYREVFVLGFVCKLK